MKTNAVAEILELPAHVDVVSGSPVDRVETSYLDQALAPERHVASRHVLRPLVVQEHVDRSARGPAHAPGHRWVLGRRYVRPTDAGRICRIEAYHQVGKPVLIGPGVGVQ